MRSASEASRAKSSQVARDLSVRALSRLVVLSKIPLLASATVSSLLPLEPTISMTCLAMLHNSEGMFLSTTGVMWPKRVCKGREGNSENGNYKCNITWQLHAM